MTKGRDQGHNVAWGKRKRLDGGCDQEFQKPRRQGHAQTHGAEAMQEKPRGLLEGISTIETGESNGGGERIVQLREPRGLWP